MQLISGIFCGGGTGCEMRRELPSGVRAHRPAEVVSSQGVAVPGAPEPRAPMTLEEWRLTSRSSRQMPDTLSSSSPFAGSFISATGPQSQSFTDVLGGHLPCTAAAMSPQDAAVTGRGLYVSVQKGMGNDPVGFGLKRQARSFELPSERGRPQKSSFELPRKPAKIRAESPGRMIPASNYEGAAEDSIDEAMARQCALLPAHRAKALLIRRIAPGEYEVDGNPVRLSEKGGDVLVCTPGKESEGSVPLARYLPRAAEHALARAPPDIELPSFPWPFDLLSRTTDVRGHPSPLEALGAAKVVPTPSLPVKPHAAAMPAPPPQAGPIQGVASLGAPIASRAQCLPRRPSMVVQTSSIAQQLPARRSAGGYVQARR